MSGWYPDPTGRFEYRFHNDREWTADVSTGGRRFVDPMQRTAQPAESSDSNGMAVAGMVCGIVAVVIAWVPFIAVLGLIAGVVGLALSIPALARARRSGGRRRGFAVAGIVTSACGIVLGILGIVLTVMLVRAIDRFDDPGAVDAQIETCLPAGDREVSADLSVENLGDEERSYTLEVDLGGTTTEWVEVDDVAAGEVRRLTFRGRSLSSEPDCRIVEVLGPVPFGLDPDVFD